MVLNTAEAFFLGAVLEGLFYGNSLGLSHQWSNGLSYNFLGAYCIVFGLYLVNLKRLGGKNILIYPIVALFFICTAIYPYDFALDFILIVCDFHDRLLTFFISFINNSSATQEVQQRIWTSLKVHCTRWPIFFLRASWYASHLAGTLIPFTYHDG